MGSAVTACRFLSSFPGIQRHAGRRYTFISFVLAHALRAVWRAQVRAAPFAPRGGIVLPLSHAGLHETEQRPLFGASAAGDALPDWPVHIVIRSRQSFRRRLQHPPFQALYYLRHLARVAVLASAGSGLRLARATPASVQRPTPAPLLPPSRRPLRILSLLQRVAIRRSSTAPRCGCRCANRSSAPPGARSGPLCRSPARVDGRARPLVRDVGARSSGPAAPWRAAARWPRTTADRQPIG